ncbi:MAG: heat-inducible transcriptional repressor HrcA [Oscillospiraceae bacterium]|jgi:heat-inducible transcriptional repressor|nr:heat-inducible transcriptional repressor HrcA [Oscillospiraceae bacterium]
MERTYKIFEAIVDEYIRTGEPVGSNVVKNRLGFPVSSATIRNEMATLEVQGYLDSPHTSAGRVPTVKGYRFYIERMMNAAPRTLSDSEREEIDRFFSDAGGLEDEVLIESASNALAELTNCAVVSANMTARFSVITKVELIPTGRRVYVLLLITSEGNIKNRVCRLSFDLTAEQMEFFTDFLNENLAGLNIGNISDEYIDGLAAALGSYMMTLSPLLKAVADLSKELSEKRVLLKGETNLIAREELQKNEIISLLESRNEFSELLDTAFSGINVMLGNEKDTFAVENSSIITGSFSKSGRQAGSFGVIGPMRLDYKKIIPYIEYFADKMTVLLSLSDDDDV